MKAENMLPESILAGIVAVILFYSVINPLFIETLKGSVDVLDAKDFMNYHFIYPAAALGTVFSVFYLIFRMMKLSEKLDARLKAAMNKRFKFKSTLWLYFVVPALIALLAFLIIAIYIPWIMIKLS
jgi:hypothetical protein